jgi:hypothetical protein
VEDQIGIGGEKSAGNQDSDRQCRFDHTVSLYSL